MYWFGKESQGSEWMNEESWIELKTLKRQMAETPLEKIIETLDAFSKLWSKEGEFYQGALPSLIAQSGFTEDEVKNTLSLLPSLLGREGLEARVKAEFVNAHVLDRFTKTPHFAGLVKASPRGLLLHVTAGNVFLSSIDSLIMGFLTKNISIVKVSSQNTFFPLYFAQKLLSFDSKKILSNKIAILSWKGGESLPEHFLKSKVDAIIAWGGEEMIQSYQKNLPPQVKFLDFGPKISLQVISVSGAKNKDLKKIAEAVVKDIIPWDQSACASPQNLYIQEGIEELPLIAAIDEAFRESAPRGPISEDEAVEILKEKYRGFYSELMESGQVSEGQEHLLHLEENKFLRPSPLGRSLIIKRFLDANDLFNHLEPFSYYLQSCSYLLATEEKSSFLNLLSYSGIKRFSPLGTITWGMEGAPHDGRFVLRELVSFVGDEARIQDYNESYLGIQTSTKLKQHFEESVHPQGYIFSSGGTTGDPKYVHYSYEEFDRTTDMLAHNFKVQGIVAGTTVANLFVAGNLWSSFLAVEKALEKIGAIQLPIGGLCPAENIITYLNKFKPDAVLGIPSLLIMNAELALSLGIDLHIKKVFYAGEAMSESRRNFLKTHWKTQYFGSAGYASVDAGVIGYQCTECLAGEHHIFTDVVRMEIVDDEGIVTSFSRDTLPIKNYATGDRIEWIGPCKCGRPDKRFKLLGRIDNMIQIWSCRLLLGDIEKSFQALDPSILSFQITLSETMKANVMEELMEVEYETKNGQALNPEALIAEIYERSRDLKDTLPLNAFRQKMRIKASGVNEIKRNARTGKISTILDRRG